MADTCIVLSFTAAQESIRKRRRAHSRAAGNMGDARQARASELSSIELVLGHARQRLAVWTAQVARLERERHELLR